MNGIKLGITPIIAVTLLAASAVTATAEESGDKASQARDNTVQAVPMTDKEMDAIKGKWWSSDGWAASTSRTDSWSAHSAAHHSGTFSKWSWK